MCSPYWDMFISSWLPFEGVISASMKKRILIVDDEPDVNLILKMVLEGNGFQVDTFDTPLLALEYFRKGLYNLVILDIKMPKMNGFELYREIRKIDEKIRTCFLTAGETYDPVYADISNQLDANCFIRKPIENQELINHINWIIDKV
jgi:two-component system, OmpR family, response regulator ChvI